MASNASLFGLNQSNGGREGMDFWQHNRLVNNEQEPQEEVSEFLEQLSIAKKTLTQMSLESHTPANPYLNVFTHQDAENVLKTDMFKIGRTVAVSIEEHLDVDSLMRLTEVTQGHERLANQLLMLMTSRPVADDSNANRFMNVLDRAALREMVLQMNERSVLNLRRPDNEWSFIIGPNDEGLQRLPQQGILYEFFEACRHPNQAEIGLLASLTRQTPEDIEDWFDVQRQASNLLHVKRVLLSDADMEKQLKERIRSKDPAFRELLLQLIKEKEASFTSA